MLRIYQNNRPADAKSYFTVADYYSAVHEQELVGEWGGRAADRLGLSGVVSKDAFDRLCDNLHPLTNEQLTERTQAKRTVGYDFNFNAPKSVSLMFGLYRDQAILDAFRASVRETMADVERDMKVRVRKGNGDTDRVSGNIAYGEFVHFTARPVNGVADPSLHSHCFVFNASHDPVENQWKAGQFRDLKRYAGYYEALFHSRLSMRLAEAGYGIDRKGRFWDIAGVSQELIDRFSRRTKQIQAKAKKLGITDPAKLAELGAATRQNKQEGVKGKDLGKLWWSQLSETDRSALNAVHERDPSVKPALEPVGADQAMAFSVQHSFERDAVVAEKRLVEAALRQSFGSASDSEVRKQLKEHGILRREREGEWMVSTRDVLAEEQAMLAFARHGRATCRALAPGHVIARDLLNAGQRAAVTHILESTDRVMIVRGQAGTGKTTLTKEAVEAIEATGKTVVMVAPTAQAARAVLRDKEGFKDADTLQRLLVDPRFQEKLDGGVLWIDEAGLVGSRDLAKVFEIARMHDARVVLMGDTKQHKAVARGAALRLLEHEGGLVPVEVKEIKRQRGKYRDAVADLAAGRTRVGFDKLDALRWVKEAADGKQHTLLAGDYADTVGRGESVLVVSPTHLEGDQTTAAIRAELKDRGMLGEDEHKVFRLAPTNLTEAERSDVATYRDAESKLVIQFLQNIKGGFTRGERGELMGVEGPNVKLKMADGRETVLPLDQAGKFQVYRSTELSLSIGDKVRITQNAYTPDKKRLDNGDIHTVAGFTANGDIRLENRWTLPRAFGHLSSGYVVTSHASQGRTVDRVLIAQSSDSLPATGQEQFYVSASRGTKAVAIYTDNKNALRTAIAKCDRQLSATELMRGRPRRFDRLKSHVETLQRFSERARAYGSRAAEAVRELLPVQVRE